jgi:hypothetical protein
MFSSLTRSRLCDTRAGGASFSVLKNSDEPRSFRFKACVPKRQTRPEELVRLARRYGMPASLT